MFYFAIPAFVISIFCTLAVRRIAGKVNVFDRPDITRKFHDRPVPLLGGVALFIAWWSVVAYLVFVQPVFGIEIIKGKLIVAFFASLIILAVGIADDIQGVSPRWRFLLIALAALVAVVFGISLDKITNPFGGVILLSSLVGDLLVFLWLMGIMFTTKISDGLDGLSTGIVLIGSVMIFFLTRAGKFYQPNVALLSLIFAAVCLGFLIFNFHPASIFLGEGGSLLIGFILGVLAIISGSKLAIAFLVISVPALDVARVVYGRFRTRQPIFRGDRRHLHYHLLDFGLSEPAVVFIFYFLSALFGVVGLLLQSGQKFAVLIIAIFGMAIGGIGYTELTRSHENNK